MRLRPLHDHIVVDVDPAPEFTRGGLVKVAPEPVRTGVVRAVGPGRHYSDKFVPTELKPGDRIAFFYAVGQTQQGKANSPENIPVIAGILAELRGEPLATIANTAFWA